MAKTILVVEDDHDLCSLLEYNLSRAGYEVRIANQVDGTLDMAQNLGPDLVLLDVMLPDGDGFDLCRLLRADKALAEVPILFLTARGEEVDRVLGLEIGGDDYITKPFSPRELVARVKAHLRRKGAADRQRRSQRRPAPWKSTRTRGEPSSTASRSRSPRPSFACSSSSSPIPARSSAARNSWRPFGDTSGNVTPRNVDVHVRRLRERIEESPNDPKWLQTVRGFGYRFEMPA